MAESYKPPFTMNEEITNLIVEIGEYVGVVTTYDVMRSNPILRRENRIRTIHSSLAIEQNTLTLEQVTDVINGKRILGPPQDIREVKNAYEAYERLSVLDPYSVKNLLLAHKIMMEGLVKSCVFHYEFEFIHPFADGNGRTGRLWQSLILQRWKEVFAWIPIETLVHENQEEYYKVLQRADTVGDSTEFVEFMLRMIRNALKEISDTHNRTNVAINVDINVVTNEKKIVALLRQDGNMSANMLAVSVGITGRQAQRILAKLKAEGKIIRHGANKNGYWEVIA